jgi:hypothetical protein
VDARQLNELSFQLEEARREAAAANSRAEATAWRNALLEKAWTSALEVSRLASSFGWTWGRGIGTRDQKCTSGRLPR